MPLLIALGAFLFTLFFLRPGKAWAQPWPDPGLFERLSTPLLLCDMETLTVEKANPAFVRFFRKPDHSEPLDRLFGTAFPIKEIKEAAAQGGDTRALPFRPSPDVPASQALALTVPAARGNRILLELRPAEPTAETSPGPPEHGYPQGVSKPRRNTPLPRSAERRDKLIDGVCRAVETLLSGGNTPLTGKMDHALEILGLAAGVDRVYVQRNRADAKGREAASRIAVWGGSSSLESLGNLPDIVFGERFADRRAALASGRCVSILVRDMPVAERKKFEASGIVSLLMAPIMLHETFWGLIGFEDCSRERAWTVGEERILRAAGTLVGAALAHEQAGEAQRLSEERFRDVASATGEVIWELGANERITFVTPRCLEVMGYTPEEMIGLSIDDIGVRPEFVERFRTELRRQISEQGFFRNLEHNMLDKFGNVHQARTSGVPLFNALGEFAGIRATSVDITAEKASARAVREGLEALQRANLELERYVIVNRDLASKALAAAKAKSEFLANIGHEVRTPINVITGMAHLALQTNLSTAQREYIEKVHSAGTSLLQIMNAILDFARMESETTEADRHPLRLRGVLADSLKAFAAQAASKGITLTAEVDPELPPLLLGDPARLGQILSNLLHNAVKFTEQGTVHVDCRVETRRENGLLLGCAIQDTGPGIPAERLPGLFEPFTQVDASTSRRHGGTGVGLALTKKLVEALGGNVSISSVPGEGTTVHFTVFLGYPPEGSGWEPASSAVLEAAPAPGISRQAAPPAHPEAEPREDLRRLESLLLDDDAEAVQLGKRLRPYLLTLPKGQELLEALTSFDFPTALKLLHRDTSLS